MFPELAPTMAGAYDVVSMHHYLEHTREPNDELKAARRVLRPGGLFGQWILNAVLTMCTGGIYAPWAMCAMWDWETRHIS